MAPQGIATQAVTAGQAVPSRARPIDLVHLARQTLGDAALEREVLEMFLRQLGEVRVRLQATGQAERRQLAHGIVGSARGVGAFALSDCAAEIEADPAAAGAVARFDMLAEEVCAFIATLRR